MVELYANTAVSSLNGAINNSTTAVVVNDASAFPATGNFRIIIDSEIFKVTAVSSNTFTVATRPQEGTNAAAHNNGATVTQVITKGTLDQFRADSIVRLNYSSLPAAGYNGRLFIPADGYGTFSDTGASWINSSPYGPTWTPPVNGSYAWVNQNSSTITQTGSGLTLHVPEQVSSNLSLRVKSFDFSAPWTATACFIPHQIQETGRQNWGMALRESGTGKLITWCIQNNTGGLNLAAFKWTNPTTFSASYFLYPFYPTSPIWLRIADDSTNHIFSFSGDGANFTVVDNTHADTDFITPDQIGFYMDPLATALGGRITLVSWLETTP